jgi:hypothetical protein
MEGDTKDRYEGRRPEDGARTGEGALNAHTPEGAAATRAPPSRALSAPDGTNGRRADGHTAVRPSHIPPPSS